MWPNIFHMHLTHVTTLPFINPRNSTVYSTTQYVHVNSYPKLDNTCDVLNTKGWVWEVDVPPPAQSTKLTIIYMSKRAKTYVVDSFLYQSGENFLYCVYEWWLFSGGGGVSTPLNEALILV